MKPSRKNFENCAMEYSIGVTGTLSSMRGLNSVSVRFRKKKKKKFAPGCLRGTQDSMFLLKSRTRSLTSLLFLLPARMKRAGGRFHEGQARPLRGPQSIPTFGTLSFGRKLSPRAIFSRWAVWREPVKKGACGLKEKTISLQTGM